MATKAAAAPAVERLPIKLILPSQGAERPVKPGGGEVKPFRAVDDQYRQRLATQVTAIHDALFGQQKPPVAAPMRVKLLTQATAKTHRPNRLFAPDTCPIVGAGTPGELFLKATPAGLKSLLKLIESNTSEKVIKELSSIEAIEAITPAFRRKGMAAKDILRRSPRGEAGFVTKVRLFNFGADADQQGLVAAFEAMCQARNIIFKTAGYSADSYTYSAECRTDEDIEEITKIIGVRSVSNMPLIRMIRPQAQNAQPLPALISRADVAGEVPVVVVVDSGVTDKVPELESWVVGRESSVAAPYRNTDHGTFVAGLICWGAELNPTVAGIDTNPCGIFDLQVIPNADPAKGDTDGLLETEFLGSLETALQQHSNEFKVWNLSLGTDAVCSLHEFSEFAQELDNLQERYKVSFVISAGNYGTVPLLDYPRLAAQMDPGRITAPADSVLGITVGSVSHVDYLRNGPRIHHPAAFSRHGAGPNHIIKPDIVHYGGSCSLDGAHVAGVRSVSGAGTAEDIGTSFAAPLVSRTLAQIYHQITPTPSPVLARALLTHHARDPRTQRRVPDGEENFLGFGLPMPVPYCLECSPYMSTLVFEDALRPRYFLEWDNFPFPPSLFRNGRFYGEIWMTVAFSPARGPRWGSEYCETHIDAKFGVYKDKKSRKTGKVTQEFKGLVPPEHKNRGVLFESYQVETLRKWAPVRTYHGDLGDNGERGNRWRLKVQLLSRHGIDAEETFRSQPFSLIVTIADPERKAPVYDEMARLLRTKYKSENLAVRAAAQIRGRH
ncbi:MAG: S8 family peptidase [Betaproteobacteria bacterium]|nr:S8 family peptidase [Betaproteobacteria bacterium]